jgi:AcrR family transcriptional regulator
MRSDARRNRERVLAAAEGVFSEMGLRRRSKRSPARAGVGVGTVRRHFPTKQALVEAVLEAMYESLLNDAAGARAARPRRRLPNVLHALGVPGPARALAEHMATEIDLSESAQSVRDAAGSDRRARHARAGRGRDPPTSVRPTSPALLGRRTPPRSRATSSPSSAAATVALILDGLCSTDPSASPGKPLDFTQLRKLKNKNAKSKPQ